ncbi:MAG TPA: hemolysin family protein [Anaerolineales bacterium]|nr:hemolysin family protein [Anaerolineales bacterium]
MTFSGIFVALLVLILIDLYLTAAKVGFVNARLARVLSQGEQENLHVEQTVLLIKDRVQLGTGLQIIHVILRFLIAGLAITSIFEQQEQNSLWIEWVIFLILAAVALSFIEQAIETRVLADPESWTIRLTLFTRIISTLFTPLLFLPLLVSRSMASEPQRFFSVTEDELRKLLDASQEEGVLEVDERKLIDSIFQFREKLAREIMVPRIDILALNVNTPVLDAVDAMLKSGFSRVPVFQESVDNIIGILYVKDLLRLCREGKQEGTLQDKLRPVYFVPETKKADELLTEMQRRRIHIALVVDEYGGVAGLVTLEDIMEEIVGEIQDEYDQSEEQIYEQINDGEFVFQARIDLDDFNEIMDSDIPKDEAGTLGGLIYSKIGRVPKGGEVIQADDILLTVEQVTGKRIRKVKAQRTSNKSAIETMDSHAN